MCGIFAYYGPKTNAGKILVQGLKSLEYRGYDSWGIACKNDSDIAIYKRTGKIGDITSLPKEICGQTTIAIGHSRWATHGGVTRENAHPHSTEDNEVVLIHNGIFENYLEVKKQLIKREHKFKSETDTEVIAHLIQENLDKEGLEESVRKAILKIEGRYAIVVICKKENKIIAARRGSPLIVGVGKNKEFYIASDIPAFLKYTNKVMYLDNNQMVVLSDAKAKFYELTNKKEIKKRIVEITWNPESAEKGEYSHFMIKEIMEQKETLYRVLNQDDKIIKRAAGMINKAVGTYFIGCGTAGKVCLTGEYIFSEIAHKHINSTFGSEFPAHHHFITNKTLIVGVSQSGETADTLEAIEIAKEKKAKVLSIVNVETSSMAQMSNMVVPTKCGPEKAVASTKVTTAQLGVITLLAYACAGRLNDGKTLLLETAGKINDMLNPRYEEHISKLAQKLQNFESMYIIGRGSNYPMALESAIKLQEVSYIHAEGFAGGELKHGPIALIQKGTPCIVLCANDENKKAILSNAMEVKARGGYIIGVSPINEDVFDYWIRVPDVSTASPIVNIIPVQILAYKLALLRKNNPDMPRNLAKSVTVK
ncbi:MAG: glucosamine/fructose-6-phosphate aminotransferase, glucosamine-fructose-6-phosphate aminotransferase (isomerizing) [Candidatus Peregrinibacteria bacterium GW2011_GWC2_39_14]|nr:MAG: glucosamine/fructose-6-phosphate aminotransferase, glucosamine-fructose-6-phosphate aminotransferase (isomerizing) [Candidatus Peregrinibacteria bacterium GW2011_GWC2_39_14]